MESRTIRSDTLLMTTAAIWGFAFVAQRIGMEFIGPFTFNGIRFALGSLSLIPILIFKHKNSSPGRPYLFRNRKMEIWGGISAGLVLFLGASLQQVGLVYTTAGKAGFITGLYVVIVPFLGIFFGQKTGKATWIGAVLAAAGLYLLSITRDFTIAPGDLLELIGAFFWAAHVLLIGWLSPRVAPVKIACFQFAVCSLLSLIIAGLAETPTLHGISLAAVPILYGGILSVGIAYTLQVVAQRHSKPAHAAIILSLESVFAALGGWIMLEETLTTRGMTGCALMLLGMLSSQLRNYLFK